VGLIVFGRVFELEDDLSEFRYGFWVTGARGSVHPLPEIHAWCVERFGEPGTVWKADRTDIWFVQQDHALEFKLRWV
jgi:hypothetical protein